MNALVEYRCVNEAHLEGASSERVGTVTLHDGKWAFCRSACTDAHDWSPTGGVHIAQLVVRLRRAGASR